MVKLNNRKKNQFNSLNEVYLQKLNNNKKFEFINCLINMELFL